MKQLKYVRHIIDTTPLYRYNPYVPKINGHNIPANTTLVPVSGTMNSFYHAFLYLVLPEYKNSDWETKTNFVQSLKDQYDGKDFMLKLTNSFNINIVVYNRKGITEFKSVFDFINIFLYFDDMGQYYPMVMNDQTYRIDCL